MNVLNGHSYTFYLNSGEVYLLMSPSSWISESYAYILYVLGAGSVAGNDVTFSAAGVRPALTINSSVSIKSGDGSKDKPYVI